MTPATHLFRRRLLGTAVLLAGASVALPAAAWGERVTGSGKVVTETRQLGSFEGVALSGSMDLLVRQGATQVVEISADDNLLPLLETEVSGSGADARLQVRWKKGVSISTRTPTRVTVTVPRLTSLVASGSGDMRMERFETPALSVRVSGSSDTRFEQLFTESLDISISGSGDVDGVGRAKKLKISISGSGDVKLREMKSDEVSISIAGSGDASVHADKALEVRIAGSGDVTYTGNASTVSSKVAGSGSVNKR
jgi:hypothetical protein